MEKKDLFYEQLINEAKILKNLKHPQIPVIYDIEEDQTYSYIILEYVKGESLRTYRLSKAQLNINIIFDYTRQVCDLLQYLHKNKTPVLYLDLKPDNLIICDGILKLIDFGAATYKKETISRNYSIGTKGYAAPEQYGIEKLDERSDIYSIGMLIFFLITGETIQVHQQYIKNIDKLRNCDKRLKYIVNRCLKYYPSQRYQSIEELKKNIPTQKEKTKNILCKPLTISLAGAQSRIGVTHVALMLTTYFNYSKKQAIYLEKNSQKVTEAILLYSKNNIEGSEKNYPIQIQDYGVLTQQNKQDFLKGDILLFLVGTKEWELKYTLTAIKELAEYENIYYLLNLTDGKRYFETVAFTRQLKCIRVPYQPNPFYFENKETLYNFINYFLEEKSEIFIRKGKLKEYFWRKISGS